MCTAEVMKNYSDNKRSSPKTLRLKITAIIERDGSSWHGFCPALKGLHVDGDNEQDVLRNLSAAASVYVNSLAMHGDQLPIGPHCELEEEQIPTVPPGALLRYLDIQWPSQRTSGTR